MSYSIRPAVLFVLFQFKLVYQSAGSWEYLLRDRVAKFRFCLPFGTKSPDKFDEPRIKGPIEAVKSYKQMHDDGEFFRRQNNRVIPKKT